MPEGQLEISYWKSSPPSATAFPRSSVICGAVSMGPHIHILIFCHSRITALPHSRSSLSIIEGKHELPQLRPMVMPRLVEATPTCQSDGNSRL